jgi:hypothetical protein
MLVRKVVHPLAGYWCRNDGELKMTNLVARKFWDGKVLHVIGAHIKVLSKITRLLKLQASIVIGFIRGCVQSG